jgi:hypothetical protein
LARAVQGLPAVCWPTPNLEGVGGELLKSRSYRRLV